MPSRIMEGWSPVSKGEVTHRGGKGEYIEAVAIAHERVVQKMAVDLRLYEDQVNEEHDEIVLDILVAEVAAAATHGQPDVMAVGLVVGRRVRGP